MSIEATAADATYRRDLGDGLVARWSTADDIEQVAHLMGSVWRRREEDPPNPRVVDQTCRQMRGDFPLMGPGDCAIVEDTRRPGNPLVACVCLWRHEWEYEGIPFQIGRPESVATDPAYRNRGLVRALFALIHARSAAEGHMVQAITGIPYYYRQFGYEYALDLNGKRVVYVSLIPRANERDAEPYTIRPATTDDIPRIMELYDRRRAASMVWAVTPERYWRYQIDQWHDSTAIGTQSGVQMIVDRVGAVQGYLIVAAKRWAPELDVYAMDVAPGVNARAVLPAVLRALQAYGMEVPDVFDSGPLREIAFHLGRSHPVYEALGQDLAPFYEPPYAWYVRVPDVPRFLLHIAPALERRLAASAAAGYSGELKLDCYRGGLRMLFQQGRLATVERWSVPTFGSEAGAGCPELVFLQLLFGYRGLDELRHVFPDVWASSEATVLLKALFPARESWVMPWG